MKLADNLKSCEIESDLMLQARTTLRRASHRKGSHGGETREEEGKMNQVEVMIFKKTEIRAIALWVYPHLKTTLEIFAPWPSFFKKTIVSD